MVPKRVKGFESENVTITFTLNSTANGGKISSAMLYVHMKDKDGKDSRYSLINMNRLNGIHPHDKLQSFEGRVSGSLTDAKATFHLRNLTLDDTHMYEGRIGVENDSGYPEVRDKLFVNLTVMSKAMSPTTIAIPGTVKVNATTLNPNINATIATQRLSPGEIAGIVIGAVIVFLIGVWILYRKRCQVV